MNDQSLKIKKEKSYQTTNVGNLQKLLMIHLLVYCRFIGLNHFMNYYSMLTVDRKLSKREDQFNSLTGILTSTSSILDVLLS